MKILLAEDSRSSQMLIKAYAEEVGHTMVTVGDGQSAVERFASERPDLVIMDVNMPIMDGIEATIEIRKLTSLHNKWIPIIFLSAMTGADDIVRGIKAGGDDYLTKPVDATVLNAKLSAMQRIAEMRQELQEANRALKTISIKDGLTGLYNRRHFDEALAKELKRCSRTNMPISLVFSDIDHFKNYNDNYGHVEGDDCLRNIAKVMKEVVRRPGDVSARYGGEEFAFILPETDIKGAVVVAEVIRKAVDTLSIKHEYSSMSEHVTLSSGVASIKPEKGQDMAVLARELIEAADNGLYQAKKKGRNRVEIVIASPLDLIS